MPGPRDARRIAAELHALVSSAGVAPPYVMVGYSYGGLYALNFDRQYPDDVAGVVLLDSSHPDQFTRTPEGRATIRRTTRLGAAFPGWPGSASFGSSISCPPIPTSLRNSVRKLPPSTPRPAK